MGVKERQYELAALKYILGKPDWVVEADPLNAPLTRLATLGLCKKSYHPIDDQAYMEHWGPGIGSNQKCVRFDLTTTGYIRLHELRIELEPLATFKASWLQAQLDTLTLVADAGGEPLNCRRDTTRAFEVLMFLYERGNLTLSIEEDPVFGRRFSFTLTEAGRARLRGEESRPVDLLSGPP